MPTTKDVADLSREQLERIALAASEVVMLSRIEGSDVARSSAKHGRDELRRRVFRRLVEAIESARGGDYGNRPEARLEREESRSQQRRRFEQRR